MKIDKAKKLNEAFQYVDDKYLELAESQQKRKKPVWLWASAAAAGICLLLILPAGVIAADLFGLRSLLLPMQTKETEAEQGGVGTVAVLTAEGALPEPAEETASKMEMIGLAGYLESPEMQALNEWQEFLAGYDSDGKILEAVGNSLYPDTRYGLYGVYSQDMADKLEEIIAKYELKLHTELNVISPKELAYRVGGEFMQGEGVCYWGYMYEDGAFQFDGEAELPGCDSLSYQLRRVVKGTFDEVILNIGDADSYQELQYVTSCGEPVMLALGPNKALIFADFDACFITMNVLAGSENGLTVEALKQLADDIDFKVLKEVRTPEMRGDSIPEE